MLTPSVSLVQGQTDTGFFSGPGARHAAGLSDSWYGHSHHPACGDSYHAREIRT